MAPVVRTHGRQGPASCSGKTPTSLHSAIYDKLRSGPQTSRCRRVLWPFDVKTLGLVEMISECVQRFIEETEKMVLFRL